MNLRCARDGLGSAYISFIIHVYILMKPNESKSAQDTLCR
jgi:hypothetical protein